MQKCDEFSNGKLGICSNVLKQILKANVGAALVRVSAKRNSFFEASHLSIAKILEIIYYYLCLEGPLRIISEQLDISEARLCDWLNFIREVFIVA